MFLVIVKRILINWRGDGSGGSYRNGLEHDGFCVTIILSTEPLCSCLGLFDGLLP